MSGMSIERRSKPVLLIVDDVELNRALLSEMFQPSYYTIEAENGRQAIDILEKQGETLAVVLLDIVMPVLDGFGVLEEMQERGWIGRIPVIMISAETSDIIMQKGYEMGAADIISKPFNPNMVRQRISNVIEQYTYRQRLEKLVTEQTAILREQAKKLRENSSQMIDTLSAIIEFKNTESVSHISNIRVITKMLLAQLNKLHQEYRLTDELIEIVSEAAAMHDVGKIAVPDHILNKPGKLTREEYEIMKTHTTRGCEILEKLSSVQTLAYYDYCYEICRHHHERWDGQGYPDGLVGNETPIWAQAVSLADVYDALSSKRVYKEAFSSEESIQMILNGECGAFNPVLIQCLLEIVPQILEYQNTASISMDAVPAAPNQVGPVRSRSEDISSRTLRLLELERQKYRIMSELSDEILFEYDIKTDTLIFSDKYQVLTGRDLVLSPFLGIQAYSSAINNAEIKRLREKIGKLTPFSPSCKLEVMIDLAGKGVEWYEVYLYSVWDTESDTGVSGYLGKLINIEEKKRENLQLKKAADSDSLTDTWNRKAMRSQITELLEGGHTTNAALFFIDIDHFKMVNDQFGHLAGDNMLHRLANSLKGCARKTDLVGRIGGDEFMVFFRDIRDQDLERKAEMVCESLQQAFEGCSISGSVGIACYPKDGLDYDTLFYRADQALYLSKKMGRNQYHFYSEHCEKLPFQSMLSSVEH